ncbi:MAG: hypothetical protein ACE5GE_09885 [Phycisphaerae bacterium]
MTELNRSRPFVGRVLAFLGLLMPLGGCGEIIWRGDLAGAQRQASRDGRLVVVYYSALLNRDCQIMDSRVFLNGDVIKTLAGTIPVRLEAAWHRRWADQLGIRQIPSFVIYGQDGKAIRIRQGPMDEAQFRAFIVAGKLNR